MGARLASGVLASALIRLAEQAGGHAMVLHKGHAEAGAFLLELYEKGRFCHFLERVWTVEGGYRWRPLPWSADNTEADRGAFRSRRLHSDPDLWIIELDVADEQRFTVDMPIGA
jgi:hypothetical protein